MAGEQAHRPGANRAAPSRIWPRSSASAPGADLERHFAELRQIAAGIELVGEVSDRVRARLLAMGELMATLLGAEFLRAQGLEVTWVDARTVLRADLRRPASTRSGILSATCNFDPDPELQRRFWPAAPGEHHAGIHRQRREGNTVLLGRGGSDTSGAYFAAKLQAQRLEIWTDVPGMFSANPRQIPTARLLKALHYDEAQEIASNGAKVLHPRCILPVRQYGIPLYIYATQTPELEGTVISAAPGEGAAQVKAIAIKKGITLISMESPGMWHEVGFLADAFKVLQGSRHVGRPGVDIGDQRHRIPRSRARTHSIPTTSRRCWPIWGGCAVHS